MASSGFSDTPPSTPIVEHEVRVQLGNDSEADGANVDSTSKSVIEKVVSEKYQRRISPFSCPCPRGFESEFSDDKPTPVLSDKDLYSSPLVPAELHLSEVLWSASAKNGVQGILVVGGFLPNHFPPQSVVMVSGYDSDISTRTTQYGDELTDKATQPSLTRE